MYVVGTTSDTLFQYTLTTPYSLAAGNVTYTGKSLVLSAAPLVETGPHDISFNSTGTVLWIVGSTNDRIYEFRLGTAWDISTAVFYDDVYIGFTEINVTGLHVIPEQNVAYIVGSTSDTVYQYSTNTPSLEIASSGISSDSSIVLNNETRVKDKLYVKGNTNIDGNTLTQGTLTVDGASTLTGNVTASGTLSVTSTLTANAAVTFDTTTSNINLATSQTTGTLILGGTSQTGAITVGRGTTTQTTNIQAGVVVSGQQKTINLGTGGAAGSRTLITVGSATAGAISTVTIPSPTNLLIGTATTTGTASQPLQVAGGAYVRDNVGIGTTNPISKLHVVGVVSATSFYGDGSSLTGVTPSRTTVVGVTTSIANNGIGNTNITGFKSYALMRVGLSTAGWLRLYTDSTSRNNDVFRSVGEDPAPGSGVIAEVVTTGISTTQIISPFVIGGNLDNPADTTIYAAITNLSGSTQAITANLTILQLEE
jgi:hypothetical protein